jgi:hypothetical protein
LTIILNLCFYVILCSCSPLADKTVVPFAADLESQVQDLQEANETAVAELANTERKMEDLQRANEVLRLGQGSQNLDLQEENQRLQDQV